MFWLSDEAPEMVKGLRKGGEYIDPSYNRFKHVCTVALKRYRVLVFLQFWVLKPLPVHSNLMLLELSLNISIILSVLSTVCIALISLTTV